MFKLILLICINCALIVFVLCQSILDGLHLKVEVGLNQLLGDLRHLGDQLLNSGLREPSAGDQVLSDDVSHL